MNQTKLEISKFIIPIGAILALCPFVSSAIALMTGIAIALLFGNFYLDRTRKLAPKLMSNAIIGLGAGMNLAVVGKVGIQGIGYTIAGISATMLLGTMLGKMFRTERDTSTLLTVGTAICGGSAIAAVASTIRAKSHEISVALGVVFFLNALALFIFPTIGHYFNLTETQFGLWSALAIHDTSSVVGSSMQFGPHALEVGTTVKLARALWIVPLTLGISFMYARNGHEKLSPKEKPKRPWFILGFLLTAALVTYIPLLQPTGHVVELVAKRVMVLTLFFIGTNLTKATVQSVGIKPFLQGISLWFLVATGTLGAILAGWIS